MHWWLLLASAQFPFPPDPSKPAVSYSSKSKRNPPAALQPPALHSGELCPPRGQHPPRAALARKRRGWWEAQKWFSPPLQKRLDKAVLGNGCRGSALHRAQVCTALLLVVGFCPGGCVVFWGNLNLVSHMCGQRLFRDSRLPDCLCE